MTPVFADTSYYIALLHTRDKYHSGARRLIVTLDVPMVTTEFVLVELGATMSRTGSRPHFARFMEDLRADIATEVIAASTGLFEAGYEMFVRHSDKEWSLTDCISFHVMRQRGISQALAYDRHFVQAGFQICESP